MRVGRRRRLEAKRIQAMLEAHGVTVVDGSKHLKLRYRGRQSVMPRHPAREMHEKLRRSIPQQLGMQTPRC